MIKEKLADITIVLFILMTIILIIVDQLISKKSPRSSHDKNIILP